MAAKSTLSKVDVLFCDRLYNNSMYDSDGMQNFSTVPVYYRAEGANVRAQDHYAH